MNPKHSHHKLIVILFFLLVQTTAWGAYNWETEDPSYSFYSLLDKVEHISRNNPDSAYIIGKNALLLARELKDSNLVAKAYNTLGIVCLVMNNQKLSEDYLLKANALTDSASDPALLSRIYNNLAKISKDRQQHDKALKLYLRSLGIRQNLSDTLEIVRSYINIGSLYSSMNNIELSLRYYLNAAKMGENIEDSRTKGSLYNSIAIAYKRLGNNAEALSNYYKALNSFKEANWAYAQAYVLGNIGVLYADMEMKNKLDSALILYSQAYEIHKQLNDSYGIGITAINKALVHIKINQFDKAEELLFLAFEVAETINSTKLLEYVYDGLSDLYHKTKNYELAYKYYRLNREIVDSTYNADKHKQIAELETKYQSEMKEQEIEKQRLLILQKQTENSKQKVLRNSFVAAFILTSILATAIFNGYRNKIKTNQIIMLQNSDLEQANSEIQAQRDQITAHRDMVINQKRNLEIANNQMTESLRYAQSIQASLLPSEKILQQFSSDYFVMMKPCQLVSGDFFWATSFEEYQVFCVADCTGHGVPGAFMSILGITALNDIVARHRVTRAFEILGYLRQSVIETLSQNDTEQLHKDGMDIGLCVLNSKTCELDFAGAGIPLWLVTNEKMNIGNEINAIMVQNGHKLYEIKGDIMPVGHSPLVKPFTSHIIKLDKLNASLYLATDGYADQLNEKTQKKFGIKKLKTSILKVAGLPMSQQKRILTKEFDEWMLSNYQIDDATILGLKV